MTPAQRKLREIREEQSLSRQKMAEFSLLEKLTDEQRQEFDALEAAAPDLERRARAAMAALTEEEKAAEAAAKAEPDSEQRERNELRSKAKLGDFLLAALHGRPVAGPSAEYAQSVGVLDGIPVAMFGNAPARREVRADMVSPSPGSNEGVNLAPIFPAIFARALLPRLGVALPQVGSGSYATMTIDTSLTAGSKAKGAAQESTPATLATRSTTAHRVAARLSIAVEDIAVIGTDSFQPMLQENLGLALSNQLDALGISGDPTVTASDPEGLFPQLAAPANAPTTVVDFDGFVAWMAGALDGGPWAERMSDIKGVVNKDTLQLSERTFQSSASYKGEMSAAAYLDARTGGGFMSSSRMPATASTIASTILYRSGTSGLDGVNAMQTATCPVWANLSIDDIYSDSASGIRHFTIAALIGDVLINHADAYQRADLKIA